MLHRALPPALCSLVLLVSHTAAVPYDFKDNYKPSPAEPTRDRAHFTYDIVGVVGGYVFTVLIWGILLLTIGRTMRRKALAPPRELELEPQGKPTLALKTSGPTSPPLSSRSWLRKFKKTDSAVQSPTVQSPDSFDQNVLDRQKEQAQADMERLYAAVMDHDAKKHYSEVSVNEADSNARRPSTQDESPVSPVKAIYPPGYHSCPTPVAAAPARPASPRSILSKRSQASNAASTTTSKSTRFNLKNLRIAGPSQKYPGAASDDDARTPLTPRFQQPALPSPPTNPNSPHDPDEELDQVQPLPRPAPQRLGSASSTSNSAPGITANKSAASSNQSLPLRSFGEPLRSPGIQTTVLDRRVDQLALTTPKTGVPFTPYSPYMPFTPITPVTPHLVSKRDRKMLAKIEGRRRAAAREDLVQTPKEIFGDAY